MTADFLDLWLKIISSVFSIGALVVAWIATRRKAINERLDTGSKRMDAHDLEIAALQAQVKSMPGKDDLHRVELSLSTIGGDIKALTAGVEANGETMSRFIRVVERQEQHLLGNGGG